MENQEKEMSFLAHLEVLRWHLVRSVLAIILFAVLAFFYKDIVFNDILFAPTNPDFISYRVFSSMSNFFGMGALSFDHLSSFSNLLNDALFAKFFAHIKISIYAGFVLSFPYVIWEIFRFVKPALHPTENRVATGGIFFSSILFLLGLLFGYYLVTPLSLNFLVAYDLGVDNIKDFINFTDVISNITTICFANGIIFELPMLVYFLSRIGLLTPNFMKKYRRHAIVLTLIFSAIITPPDPISQVLVALPILVLYEMSIKISKRVLKRQSK